MLSCLKASLATSGDMKLLFGSDLQEQKRSFLFVCLSPHQHGHAWQTFMFLGTLLCTVRYKVEEAATLMPLLHKKEKHSRHSQGLFRETPGGEVWALHHQGKKCLLGGSQIKEAGIGDPGTYMNLPSSDLKWEE